MMLSKEEERGQTYVTKEGHTIMYRKQGSVSGNNAENRYEVLYLISGEATVTHADTSFKIIAPARIIFEANTYHKVEALTDIVLMLLAE